MVNASLRSLVLAALLAAGCSMEPAATEEESAAAPVKRARPAAAPAAPEMRDTGDFQVRYGKVRDAGYREWQEAFQESRLLEDTVEELNGVFSLPADVPVVLRECGEVNAFYDPENREISLCYEMVEDLSEMFFADAETDEEIEEAGTSVANATVFTLYHELGHALIDLYDLPVTGREEDAVDQLATMILLEGGDEGENAAIDGANSFVSEEETELEDLSFWDEHSLDDQRFYNILCWIYGKNPEDYEYLVEDETLPADRAQRCPGEYARMAKSWDKLLSPYVKE